MYSSSVHIYTEDIRYLSVQITLSVCCLYLHYWKQDCYSSCLSFRKDICEIFQIALSDICNSILPSIYCISLVKSRLSEMFSETRQKWISYRSFNAHTLSPPQIYCNSAFQKPPQSHVSWDEGSMTQKHFLNPSRTSYQWQVVTNSLYLFLQMHKHAHA